VETTKKIMEIKKIKNIGLHLKELSEIIEDNSSDDGLCAECQDIGLEFMHLLQSSDFPGDSLLETRDTLCSSCPMCHLLSRSSTLLSTTTVSNLLDTPNMPISIEWGRFSDNFELTRLEESSDSII
jgi:hypothetical protein